MPVVPEKRQLDARAQSALSAQFWAQPVQSARVLTGTTVTVPCEPPPLPIVTPPGLSRTQLLVASHAAGLPMFPAWCGEQGGVVLDRAVLQLGRPRWWAALTGRVKAQRMAGQRMAKAALRDVLADPENYALAASGRLLLSNATTLRAYVQADSLTQVPASFRGWRGGIGSGSTEHSGAAAAGGSARGMSAALQLRQALPDGYELRADLAVNEPALSGVHAAAVTPLRLSVDAAPRASHRAGPLLYRAGALAVLAPATLAAAGADGGLGGGGGGINGGGGHVLAAHAQGAVALAGTATLWQASSKPWQQAARSRGKPSAASAGKPDARVHGHSDGGDAAGIASGDGDGAAAAAAAGSKHSRGSGGADAAAGAGGSDPTRRYAKKPRSAGGSAAAGPPLITPGQVQDGLQQTAWRLERLRTDLQSWASRAAAGELLGGGPGAHASGGKRGSWSSALPAPHLRVAGLVGVLGRLPLHHAHFKPALAGGGGGGGGASGGAGGLLATPDSPMSADEAATDGSGGGPAAWLRRAGAAGRGAFNRVVVGGIGGLGARLARDAVARPFASGSASLQLGGLRRWALDFTRLEASLDAGLTGPRVGGGGGGGSVFGSGDAAQDGGGGGAVSSGARHPAFALDDVGVWHALTLSATQQLIGPVRARADWRFALDSAEPVPAGRLRALGAGAPQAAAQLGRHVGGMRPSLVDAAYGLDAALPGAGGLARVALWYSPRRREGGVELRLL